MMMIFKWCVVIIILVTFNLTANRIQKTLHGSRSCSFSSSFGMIINKLKRDNFPFLEFFHLGREKKFKSKKIYFTNQNKKKQTHNTQHTQQKGGRRRKNKEAGRDTMEHDPKDKKYPWKGDLWKYSYKGDSKKIKKMIKKGGIQINEFDDRKTPFIYIRTYIPLFIILLLFFNQSTVHLSTTLRTAVMLRPSRR